MQTTPHRFQPHDLVAGHLALDLVNTVTARDSQPCDWLASYAALLEWAGLTGRFDGRALAQLDRLAGERPAAARAALARCRRLREALHAVVDALRRQRAAPAAALSTLDTFRRATAGRGRLVAGGGQVALRFDPAHSSLDLVADVVLADALALLAEPPLDRLRQCDGAHCGWLFIDLSKAGRRRWCDMATCGAAHKAERFRQRRARSAGSAA